jgi:lactate dehydrogenase-like 2-hydroxyacid dehydrogenase
VRAIFRDTSALLREFRRPIMLFLLATVGGGVLYGELLVRSGYPAIPLIDLPYIMLSLMVLQPPGAPPPEPHLIAFWYAMPVVAAIVIGRGAMDFARLFFNRNERRNAWEEAVASTYHNHVIILGIGHLGLRVARAVVEMGFEVVAIDNKITAERDLELNQIGVPLITADGRLASTLETAGLRSAQALIVCTSNDYA